MWEDREDYVEKMENHRSTVHLGELDLRIEKIKENMRQNIPITRYQQSLEITSEFLGVSTLRLMELAGRSVSEEIEKRFDNPKVAVVTGSGNNGGDGFVCARYLKNADVFAIKPPKTKIARINYEKIKSRLKNIDEIEDFDEYDVVVDAVFGTGIRGQIKEPYISTIEKINTGKYIVSIDIASGINPDTGELGDIYVKPDLTVSFHVKKPSPSGSITVREIFSRDVFLFAGPGDVYRVYKRENTAHKGDNGIVVILGGSIDYIGAPVLSAMAALRAGADLSVIITEEKVAWAINSISPDIITIKGYSSLKKWLDKADSLLFGPGLPPDSDWLLDKIPLSLPTVIDATGIEIASRNRDWIEEHIETTIFTPHRAEFVTLTGKSAEEDNIAKFTENKGALILKGSIDIIAFDGVIRYNVTGNPGMTVGGTGDVLAGITAAFLSNYSRFDAMSSATYLAGRAGDLAFKHKGYGLIASDVIDYIPKALEESLCWKTGQL